MPKHDTKEQSEIDAMMAAPVQAEVTLETQEICFQLHYHVALTHVSWYLGPGCFNCYFLRSLKEESSDVQCALGGAAC